MTTSIRTRTAALALAAMMAGCALQPVYRRPDAPVAQLFPTGPAYPASAANNATLPATEIGWRDFFTDPRLQRLVEIALANNRDLRMAALTVAQVQAQYRIQSAGRCHKSTPSRIRWRRAILRVAPRRRAAPCRIPNSVGVAASWELDFFGRLRSLKDEALQHYLASAEAKKAFEILLVRKSPTST